jgi:hypothetical protein
MYQECEERNPLQHGLANLKIQLHEKIYPGLERTKKNRNVGYLTKNISFCALGECTLIKKHEKIALPLLILDQNQIYSKSLYSVLKG